MSRIIVHKTDLDEVGHSDHMSDVIVLQPHLTEMTEIIHSREDEEFALIQAIIAEIDKLDSGEALVIHKIIF